LPQKATNRFFNRSSLQCQERKFKLFRACRELLRASLPRQPLSVANSRRRWPQKWRQGSGRRSCLARREPQAREKQLALNGIAKLCSPPDDDRGKEAKTLCCCFRRVEPTLWRNRQPENGMVPPKAAAHPSRSAKSTTSTPTWMWPSLSQSGRLLPLNWAHIDEVEPIDCGRGRRRLAQ
jgi:hypothetical protein